MFYPVEKGREGLLDILKQNKNFFCMDNEDENGEQIDLRLFGSKIYSNE
jgi:hypothetical protein